MSTYKYRNSYGKVVPRVSTILSISPYNKATLLRWAQNCNNAEEVTKRACDIGSYCHKKLECYITGEDFPEDMQKEIDESPEGFDAMIIAESGLNQFKRWESAVKPEYLASEYVIISEEQKYGGCTDLIFRINQEVEYNRVLYEVGNYLSDFKTSKYIYREHIIQMYAYQRGVREMNTYSPELRNTIIKANEGNPYIAGMEIKNIELLDDTFAFHISKDLTVADEKIFHPIKIPAQVLEYAKEDWDDFRMLRTKVSKYNKFFKSIKG